MTPRERAKQAVMNFHAANAWGYDPVQHEKLERELAKEIEAAVEAERDRVLEIIQIRKMLADSNELYNALTVIEGKVRGEG